MGRRRTATARRVALRSAGLCGPRACRRGRRSRRFDPTADARRHPERGSPRLRAWRSRLSLGLPRRGIGTIAFGIAGPQPRADRGAPDGAREPDRRTTSLRRRLNRDLRLRPVAIINAVSFCSPSRLLRFARNDRKSSLIARSPRVGAVRRPRTGAATTQSRFVWFQFAGIGTLTIGYQKTGRFPADAPG